MKKFTFSILFMLASATLFTQPADRGLENKNNPTNNQQTLKDEAGHEYSCWPSHQFKPNETQSKDEKNLVVMWDNGPFITHSPVTPNIEVNPLAFEEIHLDPPQSTTRTLTISNTGTSQLLWYLNTGTGNLDVENNNSSPESRAIIWDNGLIITSEGVGSNGSDYSELQDASLDSSENDMGISTILEPTSGIIYTNEEPITIRLENFGVNEQSDIPYQVNWSGSTGSETVNGIYYGSILCGRFVDITLDETADLSGPGTYIFEACTQLEGDENPDNDCKTKALSGPLPGNDWLWFDLFSGIINPGDSAIVTLSFESEIIVPGQYFDTITIYSDDPVQPQITIPVSLNVIYELIPPANLNAELFEAGEVLVYWTYYPTKDLQHFNIYRNDELIGTSQDTIYMDSLPDFGIYNYEVTAFYDEGESPPAGPVVVEWVAAPHIVIDPMELFETHCYVPMITSKALTVSNTGTAPLDWELYIENADTQKNAGCALDKNGKTKNRDDLPWVGMYSSGCSLGDGLVYWNLENVLVPVIPCAGYPPWYHDYKDRIHMLEPGETYLLTVQAGYADTYFDVWINYNDDDQALDDELVLDDAFCVEANQNYNFIISIPETASPGAHTMRFRTNWQNPVTHYWEEYAYGNCCDFTAHISDNPGWLESNKYFGVIEPGQAVNIQLTFNSSGMTSGIYTSDIVISSREPYNPWIEIPVQLEVEEGEISYNWNPEFFEFEFVITEDPGVDYLEIENIGTDTLLVAYEIEYLDEGQNPKYEWLSVNPATSAISPGNSQIFEVEVVFWELPYYHCEANIILYTNDICFWSQEIPVTVDIIGSVDESGNQKNIEIFPNPTDDVLNISADFNMGDIILQNHFGQVVMEKEVSGKSIQLNTSKLSGGIYFVIIESDGRQSTRKVVIR